MIKTDPLWPSIVAEKVVMRSVVMKPGFINWVLVTVGVPVFVMLEVIPTVKIEPDEIIELLVELKPPVKEASGLQVACR